MIELNNYWWEDEKRKGQEIGEKMKGRTWKKRTGRRGKEGGREEARGKKKKLQSIRYWTISYTVFEIYGILQM